MNRVSKVKHFTLYFIILLAFISCSSKPPVIVEGVKDYQYQSKKYQSKKKLTQSKKSKKYHIIKKGETLYSIAWEYGLDYKQLAKYNRIRWPYTIYVGKKLTLKAKRASQTKKNLKKRKNYKTKKIKKTKKVNKQTKVASKYKLKWQWPIKGKIIQKFNLKKDKKGIDIAIAKKGLKIRAAESGKVVYSGHGLSGYGLLLIIKHNNRYLSAYAHNSKLLVNEGMNIKKNQVIALSGKTSTDRVKLHFEIRLDGNPVNPLKYLP